MPVTEIQAQARPGAGKGAARATRRMGRVPGVIYGDKSDPEMISIEYFALLKLINRGSFLANVFDIKIGERTVRALPRDVQLDPVKDQPIHVDFQRVGADGNVRVFVPVTFINETLSPGLKRGGVLNIVRHEVEVVCPADAIPPKFEINLEGLEIGRSIHISYVALPESVRPVIQNRDFTIATIAGSASARADAEAPAAAADPKAAAGKGAAPAKGGAAPAKGGAAPAKGGAAPAKAAAKAPAKK